MINETKQTQTVFVYGTLKKGFGNNHVMKSAGGRLLAAGKTEDKYPLYVQGLPYLVEDRYNPLASQVKGELWEVDTLRPLDALEGHPTFYYRKMISVEYTDVFGATYVIDAWVYFINEREFTGTPTDEFLSGGRYRQAPQKFYGNPMTGTFMLDGDSENSFKFICGCDQDGNRVWSISGEKGRAHVDYHKLQNSNTYWPHVHGRPLAYHEEA